MPLYDYQCEAGHRYEKREPFGSPAQQPCERCGKPARRLLNAPPIVFKGSGWYKTDSSRSLRTTVDAPASESDGASEAAAAASEDGGSAAEPSSKRTRKKSEPATSTPASTAADD